MKNIKEKMQKIGKFIASRMFYLILGISVAVAIPIAYAAWNTLVNPGETLTAASWNEHVNKLIEVNNRVATLEGKQICLRCYNDDGFTSAWSCTGAMTGTTDWVTNGWSGWGHSCDRVEIKIQN
jgi:hypothetical protein